MQPASKSKTEDVLVEETRSRAYTEVGGATSVKVKDRRRIGKGDTLWSLMELVHTASGPEAGGAPVEMTHSRVSIEADLDPSNFLIMSPLAT